MKKLLGLFLGLVLTVIMLSPISAQGAQPIQCQFDFESKTLIRGQENTIKFTVTNLDSRWISGVALGLPVSAGLEIRAPLSGTFAGANYGPWLINFFPPEIVFNATQLSQPYYGYTWSVIDQNGNFITGHRVIPTQQSENFYLNIFVPESAGLGEILIANAAGHIYSRELAYSLDETQFQIVEGASSAPISQVEVLPQTGADL